MLIDESLTRGLIGSFFEVYDNLGYGLLENPYVGALKVEFSERGIRWESEVPVAVNYKGRLVGYYRTDFVIEGRVIVEVKADAKVTDAHERQLRNYLRCSSYELGLLFVFGLKPQFRRFVHTESFKKR